MHITNAECSVLEFQHLEEERIKKQNEMGIVSTALVVLFWQITHTIDLSNSNWLTSWGFQRRCLEIYRKNMHFGINRMVQNLWEYIEKNALNGRVVLTNKPKCLKMFFCQFTIFWPTFHLVAPDTFISSGIAQSSIILQL